MQRKENGAYVFYNLCPVCGRLYAEGSAIIHFTAVAIVVVHYLFGQWKKLFSLYHVLAAITAGAMLLLYFIFTIYIAKPAIPLTPLVDQATRRTILKYGVGDVIEHIITYPFENIYHFFPGPC